MILLSRFFLNLQNTISANQYIESNPSDLRFSIVQSFGGSIEFVNGGNDEEIAEGSEDNDEDIVEGDGKMPDGNESYGGEL